MTRLLECEPIEERYRSGHNGAASKADGRKPRGFESHPLRTLWRVQNALSRQEEKYEWNGAWLFRSTSHCLCRFGTTLFRCRPDVGATKAADGSVHADSEPHSSGADRTSALQKRRIALSISGLHPHL